MRHAAREPEHADRAGDAGRHAEEHAERVEAVEADAEREPDACESERQRAHDRRARPAPVERGGERAHQRRIDEKTEGGQADRDRLHRRDIAVEHVGGQHAEAEAGEHVPFRQQQAAPGGEADEPEHQRQQDRADRGDRDGRGTPLIGRAGCRDRQPEAERGRDREQISPPDGSHPPDPLSAFIPRPCMMVRPWDKV